MALTLLLPLTALIFAAFFWRRSGDALDALLKASLAYVWTAFAASEGLGAVQALGPLPLAGCWFLAAALGLFFLRQTPSRPLPRVHRPTPFVALCLGVAAFIALLSLASALYIPQWNVDVQLYHLPRVEEWVQNRSLALFPTPYDLQDFFPPGAEYLTLQFRLLCGSEALAGLGQWSCFVLSGIAVAALARSLGAHTRGQALSVLVWATLPMAVLQSASAQSDLDAVYGAALAAYFALRHEHEPDGTWDLWAAAAAGAALMLKGTDYLFVPCFWLWVVLRRDWRRPQWSRLALLALLATAPSLPYWARNTEVCGSPLGTSSMHFIQDLGPASLFSNTLKAAADELRVPSRAINAAVTGSVARIHAYLKLPMDKPEWVFDAKTPYDFYAPQRASWHEDLSGEPLQTLAILVFLAIALARPPQRHRRYLAACLGGMFLYLALVRWNIWDTRLHLPFYAVLAPLLGLALGRMRRPALIWTAAALFAAQGLWAACDNARRPLFLFGHSYQRLRGDYDGFIPGVNAGLRGTNIGLLAPAHCCPEFGVEEAGAWLGARYARSGVRLQHLCASPATSALLAQAPWAAFQPDVILADTTRYGAPSLVWGGRRWSRVGGDPTWILYLPVSGDPTTKTPAP